MNSQQKFEQDINLENRIKLDKFLSSSNSQSLLTIRELELLNYNHVANVILHTTKLLSKKEKYLLAKSFLKEVESVTLLMQLSKECVLLAGECLDNKTDAEKSNYYQSSNKCS